MIEERDKAEGVIGRVQYRMEGKGRGGVQVALELPGLEEMVIAIFGFCLFLAEWS